VWHSAHLFFFSSSLKWKTFWKIGKKSSVSPFD
jgi:hypothetical protein